MYRCKYLVVVIFYFILSYTVCQTAKIVENNDITSYRRAKRAFIEKTREYIKNNPISPELQAFINRFKRHVNPRIKRNNIAQQMYVIRDGEILPFDAKRPKRQTSDASDVFTTSKIYVVNQEGEVVPVSDNDVDQHMASHQTAPPEMGNMTVVPLMIPIIKEMNVTVTSSDDSFVTDSNGKTTSEDLVPRNRLPISRQRARPKEDSSDNKGSGSSEDDAETKTELSATERAKQVSMLNKVLEDVESLINRQSGGKDFGSEGMACDLNGDWDSSAGGALVEIQARRNETCNNGPSAVVVKFMEKDPPGDGFLRPVNWNVTGFIPFVRASIIVITATTMKNKKVVTFIGECRVCEGAEAISGNWLMGRVSADCADQSAAHAIYDDVLRKSNVNQLRDDHLNQISTTKATTANSIL